MNNTNWSIDASHSEIQFKVKHMMISTVTGSFTNFNGTISSNEDDFSATEFQFSAEISSISTNNEQRDGHLKSADFFDAEQFPQLTFSGKGLTKISEDEFTATGNLTMKGVTKEVSLKVEFGGIIQDPWGATRVGFTLDGKINRKDFGLSWSAVTETGGIVVSDEVRLHINAEFVKQ